MSTADYAKSKQGARRRQFKPIAESSDGRKKREETAVELRKNKRMESFAKRRNIQDAPEEAAGMNQTLLPRNPSEKTTEIYRLAEAIRSGSPLQQYEAASTLRKMLSVSYNPPVQEVVGAGIVPNLIEFLKRNEQPLIQFESAWVLTNVCSGTPEHVRLVIELGAVPILITLTASPNEDVREQAIWALGNIAGDSAHCRDIVLSRGAIPAVLCNMETSRLTTLRHATWAVSNFCRGKPQPAWEVISAVLPKLCKLIYSSDVDVLTDCCWALSYLTDGPTERVQALLDMNICSRVVELLTHHHVNVQAPALRIVGNIVTGDDSQTQRALDCGLVKNLRALVIHTKKNIRKEAVWTVSNITAGNRNQIQQVIDAQIFPKLVSYVKGSDFEIKREAAWALSNATASGTCDQIRYYVDEGIVDPICDLLGSSDTRMIQVALDAVENILKSGDKENKDKNALNPFVGKIEACGGLDKLEGLQSHSNTIIYEKVVSILENYFAAEEDQNVAPNMSAGAFMFGGTAVTVGASSFDF